MLGLSGIDIAIVVVYLVSIVGLGLYLQRKASKDMSSFFLGSRSLPWWALAMSGIASNVDVSGTAINSAMVYALGIKGLLLEFRGGATLSLALFAVFGKWTRRSQCMTVAEWMIFRFGRGRDAHCARLVSAAAQILFATVSVSYFSIGTGKFMQEFLQLDDWLGMAGYNWCSLFIIVVCVVYTASSGLVGVVWTDVCSGAIIFVMVIAMSIYAMVEMNLPSPNLTLSSPCTCEAGSDVGSSENLAVFIPYNVTLADWRSALPPWRLYLPEDSSYAMFEYFLLIVFFFYANVLLQGLGGPSSYMAQRYLSAKDDTEVAKMSILWILLLSFRWPFIMAVVTLALSFANEAAGSSGSEFFVDDPERILGMVVDTLPVGVKGLVLSCLVAAGASTFDSTINAGSAYWVADIYPYLHRLWSPQPLSAKAEMLHSRLGSVVISVLGFLIALVFQDINTIWNFLTVSIGGGMFFPLVARWTWPRLNGWGFAGGTGTGILTALITQFTLVPSGITGFALYNWLIIISCSTASTILVTLLTSSPVSSRLAGSELEHLVQFYRQTRPLGAWGLIRGLAFESTDERQRIVAENRRDLIAGLLVSLFLAWMSLVAAAWLQLLACTIIFSLSAAYLYFGWYRFTENWTPNRVEEVGYCTPLIKSRRNSEAEAPIEMVGLLDEKAEAGASSGGSPQGSD